MTARTDLLEALTVERFGPLPPPPEKAPLTQAQVDAWERCTAREQQLLRRRVLLEAEKTWRAA